MAKNSKPTKSKKTAADLGVPAQYLGPNGKFRPGMDARLKSDLILTALDQPAPKALVAWSQPDAIKQLAKFPQWKPFLDRKRESLAKQAKAAEEREAAKAAKVSEDAKK